MTPEIQFAGLGLAEPLLRAAAAAGYTIPTPIQAKAIPLVMAGGDLLAAAQTGTGKTAGFVLPILHRLYSTNPTAPGATVRPGRPRCLILTPTRELAAQVEESVRTYGRFVALKSMVMFGGVGIQPQITQLRKRVDILVATPGRLLDHVGQRTLDLSGVEILVLDEGDRMLDMGFIYDIKKILALMPKQRQSMLFSATFSEEVRALADKLLNKPGCVDISPRDTPCELVQHAVHLVARDQKRDLLSHLIRENKWEQVLVFTRTKHGANRLAEKLERDGIPSAAIHGNKSQSARTRALAEFKAGRVPVLVATDIAARGLDIVELPHVVNFELPNVAEDYVHRIGRTGRAGSTGVAISLVDPEEMQLLRDIERLIKRPIPRETVEGFVPGKSQDFARDDERPSARPGRQREQRSREPVREHRRQDTAAPRRSHHTAQQRDDAPIARTHSQRRDAGTSARTQHNPGAEVDGNRTETRGDTQSNGAHHARRGEPAGGRPQRNRDEASGNRDAARGNRAGQKPFDEAAGNRAHQSGVADTLHDMSEAARHQAQPQPALFSPRPQQRRRG